MNFVSFKTKQILTIPGGRLIMMRIAGVVVLYNPSNEVLENINSYVSELDCLFVIDNSVKNNQYIATKINELPQVKYIFNGQNLGISSALNTALKLADRYDFLLTMDQDSKFYDGMMKQYINILRNNYLGDKTVAMFAVNYKNDLEIDSNKITVVDAAITSGSVVNVMIAKRIGGFDENLFIDEVDHEFCYRAKRYGYKVLYLSGIRLQHCIGNPIKGVFLGKHFISWNHNKIRKYYIARNIVYMMKMYPDRRGQYLHELFSCFIKVLLVEPNKTERVFSMIKGIKDGLIGKMGRMDILK